MRDIQQAIETYIEERVEHHIRIRIQEISSFNASLEGALPPNKKESDTPIEENNPPHIYDEEKKADKPSVPHEQEESGLEQEALETVCNIGSYNGMTMRQVWALGEEGRNAIIVFSKSQHRLSKMAKVVVDHYGVME